eukprot:COSAG01_NODE_3194_length_6432_cov_70.852361_2_plen_91_part_00
MSAGVSAAAAADAEDAAAATAGPDMDTTWCRAGMYAKQREGSIWVGTITADPDEDGDVRLRWVDGTVSGALCCRQPLSWLAPLRVLTDMA